MDREGKERVTRAGDAILNRVRGRKVKIRDEVREVGGGPDYTGSYSH